MNCPTPFKKLDPCEKFHPLCSAPWNTSGISCRVLVPANLGVHEGRTVIKRLPTSSFNGSISQVSFPRWHLHLLCRNHFLYLRSELGLHSVPLAVYPESLEWSTSSTFRGQLCYTPFLFSSNCTFSVLVSHFFAELPSLLAHLLFRLSIFVKLANCHARLPLTDKETTAHWLCVIWKLDTRWSSHWWTLKEVMWLIADHDEHLLLTECLVNWRTGTKVCPLCTYGS